MINEIIYEDNHIIIVNKLPPVIWYKQMLKKENNYAMM